MDPEKEACLLSASWVRVRSSSSDHGSPLWAPWGSEGVRSSQLETKNKSTLSVCVGGQHFKNKKGRDGGRKEEKGGRKGGRKRISVLQLSGTKQNYYTNMLK